MIANSGMTKVWGKVDRARWTAVVSLLLLAGCQKSFDERYAEAQKKMSEQAASIDKELGARASEAAMGEASATTAVMPTGAGDASPPS